MIIAGVFLHLTYAHAAVTYDKGGLIQLSSGTNELVISSTFSNALVTLCFAFFEGHTFSESTLSLNGTSTARVTLTPAFIDHAQKMAAYYFYDVPAGSSTFSWATNPASPWFAWNIYNGAVNSSSGIADVATSTGAGVTTATSTHFVGLGDMQAGCTSVWGGKAITATSASTTIRQTLNDVSNINAYDDDGVVNFNAVNTLAWTWDSFLTNAFSNVNFVLQSSETFPSVAFTHPTNGTTTADYTDLFWTGTFDFATSTFTTGQVVVLYSQVTSTIINQQTSSSLLFYDLSEAVSNSGTWTINKSKVLWDNATSTWYAQALLTDTGQFGAFVASTSIISFTVAEPQAPTTFAVSCTATSTLPSACISNGSFFGDVKQGVCVALSCTFIPSPSQQAAISTEFLSIKNSVSSKPPVGYFTLAYNALTDALTTTTTGFFSGSLTALNVLVTPLDLGMAGLLGLLFLVWLIHRIRDFHL